MESGKNQAVISRAGWIFAGLALCVAPAHADPPGRVELATHYSYLISQGASEDGDKTFHGYRSDLSIFINRRFGVGATLVNSQSHNADLLFGPDFGLLDKGRVSVQLHGRAGWVKRSAFFEPATSTGPSLDVTIAKGWILRVQPEVIWWSDRGTHTDFRISAGFVVRWGTTR